MCVRADGSRGAAAGGRGSFWRHAHLRRSVLGRARDAGELAALVEDRRVPKVDQRQLRALLRVLARHHHVLGLHISVDNVESGEGVERLKQLPHERGDEVVRERAALLDQLEELAAGHALHRQVDRLRRRDHLMEAHDVCSALGLAEGEDLRLEHLKRLLVLIEHLDVDLLQRDSQTVRRAHS